jgi:hypothetical protein
MNEDKINKISSELAKRISEAFKNEKKLLISDITTELEGRGPFRDFFKLGFWAGNGFIYRFFEIGKASGLVMFPYADLEATINEDEAQEILKRVKKILSEKYEIERYCEDDD